MSESIFTVTVWSRRTPRSRWRVWERFSTMGAAIQAAAEARRRGVLREETLTIPGDRNPNEVGAKRKE